MSPQHAVLEFWSVFTWLIGLNVLCFEMQLVPVVFQARGLKDE